MLLALQLSSAFSAVYYIATNGSDLNTGSINEPFATIQRSQTAVSAGDTVYIRGGIYLMTEAQIAQKVRTWTYVTYLDKSGTTGKRINYWAYPGEKPVFDLSNIKPSGYRITVFYVSGSYIHIKGIEVIGTQVTITGHTQSECFENNGSNNIYELLKMHDGQAIGFYLLNGSDNLILNCDAYRNWDYISESGKGGNTDGFGCHPSTGSKGNIFRGCRAWFNSDDGYDCISASESVIFENCWAFYNGYSSDFKGLGDGNGFKIGGHGGKPFNKLPQTIPSHTVKYCLSVQNKANGFYSNHNLAGSNWYNNAAYNNSVNYNMLNRDSLTAEKYLTDVPGYNHVMKNNIGFQARSAEYTNINTSRCTLINNYFNSNISLTTDDFVSLDLTLLVADRKPDGSLPDNGFMKLKSTGNFYLK